MGYDIIIPIRIGLFSLTVTILVVYFFSLVSFLRKEKITFKRIVYIALHIAIMLGGLLLTGFAKWLQ